VELTTLVTLPHEFKILLQSRTLKRKETVKNRVGKEKESYTSCLSCLHRKIDGEKELEERGRQEKRKPSRGGRRGNGKWWSRGGGAVGVSSEKDEGIESKPFKTKNARAITNMGKRDEKKLRLRRGNQN